MREGEEGEGGELAELRLGSSTFLREAREVSTGKWVNSRPPLPLSLSRHHLLTYTYFKNTHTRQHYNNIYLGWDRFLPFEMVYSTLSIQALG